jgi:predicted Zn-dependent protease
MKQYLSLLLLLLAPLFSGCEQNAMGRKAIAIMPDSLLNSQSAQVYAQSKQEKPLSKNKRHAQLVQQVGHRLIAVANRDYANYCQGFQWEVVLFEEPKTKNAYCMPGGKIAIYSGILPVCKNEAALAAVMGHEIAHALLRHGNERVSQQLGITAITLGAGYALEKSNKVSDSSKKNIMIAIGLGSEIGVALPFSRMHEREADYLGLRIMAKAGYDPKEAPALWERMKASGGASPPELLSTHPSSESRITDLRSKQREAQELYRTAAHHYGKGENF